MHKAADAYRSIGEVAKLIGVAPHVLRYWETQFPQLAPVKRPDGRRYYRLEDVRLAAGLAEVMREEGLTARGAARLIAMDKGATVRAKGMGRLPARFGAEAGGVEAEAPAKTRPAGVSRVTRPKSPTAPDADALPLFPEAEPQAAAPAPEVALGPEPAPATTAGATLPPHPASALMLHRLVGLAAALRAPGRAPLAGAQLEPLRRRLRGALDARG